MRAGEQRLPRGARLRDPRDYARVNRAGQRHATAHFVAVVASTQPRSAPRLGLAVSRRVGNAVARNRVKRRVREWFRRTRSMLPRGADWVVIARSGAAQLDAASVTSELDQLAAG